jgi:uncharacterized membrane protein (UPF0127 family)
VKRIHLLVLCLIPTLWAGCTKTAPPPPSAAGAEPPLPTQAQPKLRTLKLYLGPETLDAELALTQVEEQTGMMFRTNILDTDAMLFDLHAPVQASFWMTNCPESISAAYIRSDGVIAEIHHLEKNDATPVTSASDNIMFVLETSEGWFTRHHVTTGMEVRTERGSLLTTFQGR